MTQKYVIGIDLGGTFIKGGAVSEKGKIIAHAKKESGAKESAEKPVSNMLELIDQLSSEIGNRPEAIGFGIPGAIYSEKGIVTKSPHFPHWTNFDLGASIKKKSAVPYVMDNDANAAALGEGWMGAGKGFDHYCCMTLGTGIGGGIVLNGSIWKGTTGMAGEVGHIVVEPEGRQCLCGGKGCMETYSSATGIVKTAREKFNNNEEATRLREITNNNLDNITPEILSELAGEGDSLSKEIFKEMGKYLGIGFANIINILNLELIILGGGVLPAWDFFIDEAMEQMKMRTYKVPGEAVQIVKAKCGNDAGLLGAAYMAWQIR